MRRLLRLFLPAVLCIVTTSAGLHIVPRDSVEKRLSHYSRNLDTLTACLGEYRSFGDSSATGMALYYLGRYYNQHNDFYTSITHYKGATAIFRQSGQVLEEIKAMIGMATSYRRINAYADASTALFDALNRLEEHPSLAETYDGKRERSYIYNGIGNIYKFLDNGIEAERYFRLSMDIDREIGNNLGLAMNCSTLGSIYEHRNAFDSAAVMFNRALQYNAATHSTNGMGICHNNLGQLAMLQNDFREAEKQFILAYGILKQANDRWNLVKTELSLADLYLRTGDPDKAMAYIDPARKLVDGTHSFGYEQEIHRCLSEYYSMKGNTKAAFEEARLCQQFRDSLSMQKDEQAVAGTRIKFDEEQNQIMLHRMTLDRKREANLRLITILFTAILVALLLLTAFILLRLGRLQYKRNQELMESTVIKKNFFSMVSRDLKNPMITQNMVLNALDSNFDAMDKETIRQQVEGLNHSSDAMLEMLNLLLDWSRIEVGMIRVENVRMNLYNVADEAVKPLSEKLHKKGATLRNLIPSETFALADMAITTSIIRNLTQNALNYVNAEGHIVISSEDLNTGWLQVKIQDNGPGIPTERIEQLLSYGKKGTDYKDIRSGNHNTSGLTISVCKSMAELLGGTLRIESEPGKGTAVLFSVRKTD